MSSFEKGEVYVSSRAERIFNIIKQDKDISSQEMADLYDDFATSYDKVILELYQTWSYYQRL